MRTLRIHVHLHVGTVHGRFEPGLTRGASPAPLGLRGGLGLRPMCGVGTHTRTHAHIHTHSHHTQRTHVGSHRRRGQGEADAAGPSSLLLLLLPILSPT